MTARGGGEVSCTVVSFDHPGAFSLITGVLSSRGYDIRSGDIFTWAPAPPDAPRELSLRRRRIVDCFTGVVDPAEDDDGWAARVEMDLRAVCQGLERGGEEAATARRTVNEMAARRLRGPGQPRETPLYPVRIEMVEAARAGSTAMRVISRDTPFFLYTFSLALTLQEVSIEHVTIRTAEGRIEDTFEFVDTQGRAITETARIDRIKLSVLLTKQFTSFLESAPDPLTALARFEHLVRDLVADPDQGRWVRLLSDQAVMRDLAQILGASTFLWEDFVRLQYETLLPLLAPHMSSEGFSEPLTTLPTRLTAALDGGA